MIDLAIWSSSKAKLSTVDYLEADRLDRIAAQVQSNCVSKLMEAISLMSSMHGLY